MAKPICIITPTGMICSASPLRRHGPSTCDAAPPDAKRDLRVKAFKGHMATDPDWGGLDSQRQAVIARVVDLMLAANVSEGDRFTIVKSD